MKRFILLIMMMVNFCIVGSSQSCCPDGIVFTRQSQIDSFPINNPNCIRIEGDVSILGIEISNLSGLNEIKSIGGNVKIGETTHPTNLTGFTGLNNLDSIGGTFGIENNPFLISFSGLSQLKKTGNGLIVRVNDNLASFDGLNNLEQICGDFRIESNFGLINLVGLGKITKVWGDVQFYNNAIINFMGLDHLNSIMGTLKVSQNYKLQNISDLINLVSIGENLEILANDSLSSLNGLDNLQTIGGSIDLHYNDALLNLKGIKRLDTIKGNISIYSNVSLSRCAVESICSYMSNPTGFMNIHDNALGCNSLEQIKSVCDTMSVPENFFFVQYSIYPNPANDYITISGLSLVNLNHVCIYNQLGQKVITFEKATNSINISNLRSGFYFIEFSINDVLVRKPFEKK